MAETPSLPCSSSLLLICLLCVIASTAEVVLPTPQAAASGMPILSFQDPKYSVQFHSLDSPYLQEADQEVMVMTSTNRHKFSCALPRPQVLQGADPERNATTFGLAADQKSTRRTPEDLLDVLKDKCILKREGWWMYEFCYQKHFRQFHLEKDHAKGQQVMVQEFLLGTYDAAATAALHHNSSDVFMQPDPRSQVAAHRYHAHIFSNGTMCDLTNELRETEVRFVCAEDEAVSIISLKEAPTCKYTIVISVPALCKHPSFYRERPPWVVIHCTAIESSQAGKEADSGPTTAADDQQRTLVVSTLVPLGDIGAPSQLSSL